MNINITIQLFGITRTLSQNHTITCQLPYGSTLHDIRKYLKNEFTKHNLKEVNKVTEILQSSVFANNEEIISNNIQLYQDITLALMPPVCGG